MHSPHLRGFEQDHNIRYQICWNIFTIMNSTQGPGEELLMLMLAKNKGKLWDLPTGKVECCLPKDYASNLINIHETLAGDALDHSSEVSPLFTTFPVRRVGETKAHNPDGWSECILDKPPYKKLISSIPGFPHPLPKSLSSCLPRYRIAASQYGGLGMFAQTEIKAGHLIAAERPLLVFPIVIAMTAAMSKGKSKEEMMAWMLASQGKYMEYAVGRMLPEDQAAYRALANSHLHDGSGPLFGIARTNGFGMSFEDGEPSHSSVYNVFSRINHSCLPNACEHFDKPSFSGRLYALRDIKPGEEIFVSYNYTARPRAERTRFLKKYGFTCKCLLCTSTSLESLREAALKEAIQFQLYLWWFNNGRASPRSNHESMLRLAREWIKKLDDSRFHDFEPFSDALHTAAWAAKNLGKREEAVEMYTRLIGLQHARKGQVEVDRLLKTMINVGMGPR